MISACSRVYDEGFRENSSSIRILHISMAPGSIELRRGRVAVSGIFPIETFVIGQYQMDGEACGVESSGNRELPCFINSLRRRLGDWNQDLTLITAFAVLHTEYQPRLGCSDEAIGAQLNL